MQRFLIAIPFEMSDFCRSEACSLGGIPPLFLISKMDDAICIGDMVECEIFYRWNLLRLQAFSTGLAKWQGTSSGGESYFDQVEFFRRTWLWQGIDQIDWDRVLEFFRPFQQSFLVDVLSPVRSESTDDAECIHHPSLRQLYRNTVVALEDDMASWECSDMPCSLEIQAVVSEEDMSVFSGLYLEGFQASSTSPAIAKQNLSGLLNIPNWHPFLLSIDGVWAGACAFFLHEGCAFLSSVTIRPAYRGRGLHAWLIRDRIRRARALGAHRILTYAQTGSISHHNLIKCGLRPLCEIATYRHHGFE